MSKKQLLELLKYCSPNILYVVEGHNRIIKLYTPFRLLVLSDIGVLLKGQIVYCTEMRITDMARIVFLIDGKKYHTHYFDILTG